MATFERNERDIKREIIRYLQGRGHLVIPYRNVGVFKPKDGHYIPAMQLGISDIIGIVSGGSGCWFFIEVKRPGNKLSIHQLEFLRIAAKYGCIAMAAYSVEDVAKAGL